MDRKVDRRRGRGRPRKGQRDVIKKDIEQKEMFPEDSRNTVELSDENPIPAWD